jgi:hypothetical protein
VVFGSCQCETLRMYLPFSMYLICVLFVLRPSFLSRVDSVVFLNMISPNVCSPHQNAKRG